MKAQITIRDSSTGIGMSFNEFVLYRTSHYRDEKQILIICVPKGEDGP